jgi:hypothetical protein
MDFLTALSIITSIVVAIATCVQAWTAWKQYERENKRQREALQNREQKRRPDVQPYRNREWWFTFVVVLITIGMAWYVLGGLLVWWSLDFWVLGWCSFIIMIFLIVFDPYS